MGIILYVLLVFLFLLEFVFLINLLKLSKEIEEYIYKISTLYFDIYKKVTGQIPDLEDE